MLHLYSFHNKLVFPLKYYFNSKDILTYMFVLYQNSVRKSFPHSTSVPSMPRKFYWQKRLISAAVHNPRVRFGFGWVFFSLQITFQPVSTWKEMLFLLGVPRAKTEDLLLYVGLTRLIFPSSSIPQHPSHSGARISHWPQQNLTLSQCWRLAACPSTLQN